MCSIITLHPVQSGNRPPVAGSHKTVWKTDHRSPVAGSTISAIWFSSYFSLHKPIFRLTVKKLLNLNPRSKNLPGNLTVLGLSWELELSLNWDSPGNFLGIRTLLRTRTLLGTGEISQSINIRGLISIISQINPSTVFSETTLTINLNIYRAMFKNVE